jgi:predicted glycosyltransferase
VRVLFSILTPGFLRPFPSVVRLLADRGHEVVLAFHRHKWAAGTHELVDELAALPGVRVEEAEVRPLQRDAWHELALDLRSSVDYLHFLEPRFDETYRARSIRRAPRPALAVGRTRLGRSRPARRALISAIRLAERTVPTSAEIEESIRRFDPDVVLFTPYMALRTVQPDYLRAAQALGLPTAILVTSWDNLTSKSLIDPLPDRLFVWNAFQRREAAELHGVPAERVVVTGAQCFDDWLGWQARPREAFLRGVGLDPAGPYVLYPCSAPWTRRPEVDFVTRWIAAFRAARPELAEVGVMIRPHPKRPDEWRGVDLSRLRDVVVWPGDPRLPTDTGSKADYYDSIYHSAAVVGLNTTVMIEAALIGRPVLTILADEFRAAQEGTLHFRYLLEAGGGILQVARGLDEHAGQLAAALADPGASAAGLEAFVREFVRPHGLGVPATPIFVSELERLGELARPAPRRTPLGLLPLRPVLKPLARRAARYAR